MGFKGLKLEETPGNSPIVTAILDDHELAWMHYATVVNVPKTAEDKIVLGLFELEYLSGMWRFEDEVVLHINDIHASGLYNGYCSSSLLSDPLSGGFFIAGTRHHEGTEITRLDDLLFAVAEADCFDNGTNFEYERELAVLEDNIGFSSYYEGISLSYGNRGFSSGGVLQQGSLQGYFVTGTSREYLVSLPPREIYVAFYQYADDSSPEGKLEQSSERDGNLIAVRTSDSRSILLTLAMGNTSSDNVNITFFDISGRTVGEEIIPIEQRESLSFQFDGYDSDGNRLQPGVYFCRVLWEDQVEYTSFSLLN